MRHMYKSPKLILHFQPVLFGIGFVLYNLLFHPLAVYNGPWYVVCSPVWYVVSLFRGTLAFDVQKLHERYGDVVRISYNELSYRQVEAWKDIYGPLNELPDREMGKDPVQRTSPTIRHATRTLKMYQSFYGGFAGGPSTITTANHADHTRFRRLLAPAFSQKALADQESLIKQYIDLLIQRLHERAGTKQNMSAWFNVCPPIILPKHGTLIRIHSLPLLTSSAISPSASPFTVSKRPNITHGSP